MGIARRLVADQANRTDLALVIVAASLSKPEQAWWVAQVVLYGTSLVAVAWAWVRVMMWVEGKKTW